ncbi:MAG: MerR family transcriptional regulator [Mycobacteriales bacterium]
MSWSIAQVARMSNVTSRTLRHYDAIGLLRPAGVGANGHRFYERSELLRLQQILLLRALGVRLDDISRVVDEGGDAIAALRRHREALLSETQRLTRLVQTVELTIEDLERGQTMPAEQLFDGFDPAVQAEYENEIKATYGEESVAESRRRTAGWTPEQYRGVARAYGEIEDRLVPLIDSGTEPGDAGVLAVIADHYAIVDRFWTPDAAAYTGLGQLYVDDPRFRARYDARHPQLAEFLRAAMAEYARTRLG